MPNPATLHSLAKKSETIRKMGDKAKARETMEKAKVPIIPGSDGAISNETQALKVT